MADDASKLKRRRTSEYADIALNTEGSVRKALDGIYQVTTSTERPSYVSCRKSTNIKLYEKPSTCTPYGTICQTSEMQGKKDNMSIYHVNPLAFLYHALVVSTEFAKFLYRIQSSLAAEMLVVCLYLDETTPGNQQRPDNGRSCQCLYYTLLQYPM